MAARAMARRRRWLVHGLLASILALTALSFARRASLWPFSHYPMFSHVRTRTDATTLEVYVVGPRGESLLSREDATFFRDLDGVGVRAIASGIAERHGPASEQSRRFLALLLDVLRREAGPDADAAPDAVRLYRVAWRFADADDPRRFPTDRTLLAEATGADSR